MKITKLLCIKLVGKNYIVVEDAGENRTIPVDYPHNFKTNDLYELTEEPKFFIEENVTEKQDNDVLDLKDVTLETPVKESMSEDLTEVESE